MPESRSRLVTQLLVAALIGGLAFAVVLQTRDDQGTDYSSARSEDLVELLKSLDAANRRIEHQISELTATRNDLLDSSKRTSAAAKAAREQADALAILSGTVGATGPGVTIAVSDPDHGVDAAALLDAVEELRNAGAEAIAINGTARVIGRSYIVDADDGIRVDGRTIVAPYVIEAIGDAATLAEAARIIGGLVDTMERHGATVTITEQKTVSITALADAKEPEYARSDP